MHNRSFFGQIMLCLIAILSSCKSIDYQGDKQNNYQANTTKAQILRRSAQWHETIASRNLTGLLELFSPDAHFASAGGKWAGKDIGLQKFSMLLKKRPDLQWDNRPKKVVVNEDWGVAYETGDWTEGWTEPDGTATIHGTYFLMWKKTAGQDWLIHAAIFTPLLCTGSSQYCKPQDQKITLR